MKRLPLALLFLPALAASNETIESDSEWAKSYMENFKDGMLLEYVYKVLVHKKDKVEFYNNCTKEFEYPMQDCEQGYNLVTTIELPGNDPSLGKGDLQMYFTFNEKQQLVESMHELYYPAHRLCNSKAKHDHPCWAGPPYCVLRPVLAVLCGFHTHGV